MGSQSTVPGSGTFAFSTLEKVVYGPRSARTLNDEVDRLGGRRVFLVTGNTLSKTALFDRLTESLGHRLAGVYSGTRQHSPRDCVLEAAELARDADADLVVSFGGGSSIDLSKMVALCLAEGIRDHQAFDPYVVRRGTDGRTVLPEVRGRLIPHIALPTTLSAPEFSPYAGCADNMRVAKDQFRAPGMAPRTVILDPELTAETPASLWAVTGVRSVDHCVEALYSTAHQPFADALAIQALTLLFEHLVSAAANPNDITARGMCQLAAWMSLYSLNNVMMGLSHAIGHQLGAQLGMPHGATSCVALPAVMRFNAAVAADRLSIAARAMGIETSIMSAGEAADVAADRVQSLVDQLGIESRLREWGATEDDLPRIADETMLEFLLGTNPRPVTRADVLGILHSVL